MQYEVRALAADNQLQTLIIESGSADEARRVVSARGLETVTVRARPGLRRAARAPRFPLTEFCIEMAALLDAGLSVVEALEGLAEKEGHAATRQVHLRQLQRLRDGQRWSQALRADVDVFGELLVGIVQAAEGTSDLPRALSRFVAYRERMQALRNRVLGALVYPLILLAVGGAVTVFLMAYVVPRFALVYEDAGRALPWASQWLLAGGRWLASHAAGAAVAAFALAAGGAALLRGWWRSGRLLAALAQLPVIGERLREARLGQVYLTLGLLLEGGLPVAIALEMLRASSPAPLARLLDGAVAAVRAGAGVSQAFEAHGLATPIALRLLRAGERSGRLAAMLEQAAAFHEARTARWIDRFSRAFEPALMALIGAAVGAIVILLYMPVFDLAGSFG